MQDKKWLLVLLALAAGVVLVLWWRQERGLLRAPKAATHVISDEIKELKDIEQKISQMGLTIHESFKDHPEDQPLSKDRFQQLDAHIKAVIAELEVDLKLPNLSRDDRLKLEDYKSHLEKILAAEEAKHKASLK